MINYSAAKLPDNPLLSLLLRWFQYVCGSSAEFKTAYWIRAIRMPIDLKEGAHVRIKEPPVVANDDDAGTIRAYTYGYVGPLSTTVSASIQYEGVFTMPVAFPIRN